MTFINTVLLVHTVNKTLLLYAFRMPPVFTIHFVQYLRYKYGPLSVYRVKVKTLKARLD